MNTQLSQAIVRIRAELGVPEGGFLIGCVGRLATQKRVNDVIHMTDVLHMAGLPVRTVIVGDGPRRAELERFANNLERQNVVVFLGHRADARGARRASDAG